MRPTSGDMTSVEFEAAWVLDREEQKGDVVGFYHTHPSGQPAPSRRDVRTMRAWCGSFGKALLCLIEASGNVAAYRFDTDESEGIELEACERFPRGVVIALDMVEHGEPAHDPEVSA